MAAVRDAIDALEQARSARSTDSAEELPRLGATMDGESHETAVLVAVLGGCFLATLILLILVTLIERSRKKLLRSYSDLITNQHLTPIPSISSQISASKPTISRTSSTMSSCSGILVNGKRYCCQDIKPKAPSGSQKTSRQSSRGSSKTASRESSIREEPLEEVEAGGTKGETPLTEVVVISRL